MGLSVGGDEPLHTQANKVFFEFFVDNLLQLLLDLRILLHEFYKDTVLKDGILIAHNEQKTLSL